MVPTQGGFDYGCKDGATKFFAFDVFNASDQWRFPAGEVPSLAPAFYGGAYAEEKIKGFVDGKTTVEGANHVREGIVVRPVPDRRIAGLGRLQLKLVSNAFLEKQ